MGGSTSWRLTLLWSARLSWAWRLKKSMPSGGKVRGQNEKVGVTLRCFTDRVRCRPEQDRLRLRNHVTRQARQITGDGTKTGTWKVTNDGAFTVQYDTTI